MLTKRIKIRLLPIFIFVACLSLSVKVSNVTGIFRQMQRAEVKIEASTAAAEDQVAEKITSQLKSVLEGKGKEQEEPSNTISNSEILILQELAERREALDVRARDIDKRAIQLKVAEKEIDKKLRLLKEYEQRLNKLVNQYTQKEQENVNALVKLYSSMKPKDAARIFNTLDLDITVAILRGMKPSNSSAIVSQMESDKAQAVTAELIGNNI